MPKDKDQQADEDLFSAIAGSGAADAGGTEEAGVGTEAGEIPQALINYLGDRLYNTSLMIEYLCLYRFPVLQVFDEALYDMMGPPAGGFPGTLLDRYRAEGGLTIYIYEHCIMIGTGEMAYMDGNYTRMLRAMYEIFQTVVPERMAKQNWKNAAFVATHPRLENVAWVIAKQYDIPVNLMLESKEVEVLYQRIQKHKPGTAWVNFSKMQQSSQPG